MNIKSYKGDRDYYLVNGKLMINTVYVDKNNALQNKYIKACMSNGCKLVEIAKASRYFKTLIN